MKKQMMAVEVRTTTEGTIEIAQDGGIQDEQYVIIYPDQVDALIRWLAEAKDEALGGKSVGDAAVEFLSGLPTTMLSSDHPDYERFQEIKARIG